MKFYIKQIKLWFRRHPQPIAYDFEPNLVNVITGDSSTGKSSILRIIDYCLFANESSIVEDIINENVSWYGLIFHLNGVDYAVARRAPENGRINNDIFWEPETDSFPDETPVPNPRISRAQLVEFMDRQFNVANIRLSNGRKSLDLHYRHMLMLSYLTEDIIATVDTYFDSRFFGDGEFTQFVQDILKFAIFSDEDSLQKMLDQKKRLTKAVNDAESQKRKDALNEETYHKQLEAILAEAVGSGLCTQDEISDISIEVLIARIRHYVEEFNRLKRSHSKLEKIGELQKSERELSAELREFSQLQYEYNRALEYAKKVKDSIMPLDYLLQNIDKQILSNDTVSLYQSLPSTFENLKEKDLEISELPSDFKRRRQLAKDKHEKICKEISDLEKASEIALNPDKLYRSINLEMKLNALKKKPATYIGDTKLQESKDELSVVDREIEIVKNKNAELENSLNQSIQAYYDLQDGMSGSYSSCSVRFVIEDLLLRLTKPGEFYGIKNVGSKSNYMFMHLCFFFGLHEYLAERESASVPRFLFIDQPSIPYYSSRGRTTNESSTNDLKLKSKDDETRLKSAFKLIDQFMGQNTNNNGMEFQIIMIEHADPEYWSDLKHFKTKYIFTEDKHYGLIPKYVDVR